MTPFSGKELVFRRERCRERVAAERLELLPAPARLRLHRNRGGDRIAVRRPAGRWSGCATTLAGEPPSAHAVVFDWAR